jgi:hypothetical protein
METLTLEQAYYIGELIGLVIVVVSLIYVGQQLSQNNRSQRIAAVQLHNETYRQNLSFLAEHSEVWIEGLNDFSNLDAAKRVEFGMVIQCVFRHVEQSYFMMTEDVLKEGTYLSVVSNASNILAYPGAIDWWRTRKEFFDGEFIQSLESHLKLHEATDLYQIREKE